MLSVLVSLLGVSVDELVPGAVLVNETSLSEQTGRFVFDEAQPFLAVQISPSGHVKFNKGPSLLQSKKVFIPEHIIESGAWPGFIGRSGQSWEHNSSQSYVSGSDSQG